MDSSDLIGAELDAAVARACSELIAKIDDRGVWVRRPRYDCAFNIDLYSPSTDWSQGGPIIERERIAIHYGYAEVSLFKWDESWMAGYNLTIDHWDYGGETGSESSLSLDYQSIVPTPLIAAMRAFVASKK